MNISRVATTVEKAMLSEANNLKTNSVEMNTEANFINAKYVDRIGGVAQPSTDLLVGYTLRKILIATLSLRQEILATQFFKQSISSIFKLWTVIFPYSSR